MTQGKGLKMFLTEPLARSSLYEVVPIYSDTGTQTWGPAPDPIPSPDSGPPLFSLLPIWYSKIMRPSEGE